MVSGLRDLLAAVLRKHDHDTLLVLSDWCEERELTAAANTLRANAVNPSLHGWSVVVMLATIIDETIAIPGPTWSVPAGPTGPIGPTSSAGPTGASWP